MKMVLPWVTLAVVSAACSPAPPASSPAPPTPPPTQPTATALPSVAPTPPTNEHPNQTPTRPNSVADLTTRALVAIKARDGGAYNQLMFRQQDVAQSCPKMRKHINAEYLERMHESVARSVADCGKHDWSQAKEIGRSGGERKNRSKPCAEEVWELEDIRITFQIGAEEVRLKLDDPVEFPNGIFAFTDNPRCGGPGTDVVGPAPPDVPPPPPPPGPERPTIWQ